MRQVVWASLILGLPSLATASELDDIKGWRATRTVTVTASPDYVAPYVADFEKWAAWSTWGPTAKVGCAGTPGVVGRTCTWTADDGRQVKMDLTEVGASDLHYAYYFGDLAVPNKAILSWTSADGATTVTWDTAGSAKSVPKELKKTAAETIGGDLDAGLAKLKTVAEADARHAAEVAAAARAAAEKKATELEAAARAADDESKLENSVWQSSVAAADAAKSALAAAKPKDKAKLQAAADAAQKSADAAFVLADTAARKAAEAHQLAEVARAEATALGAAAP